MLGYEYAYVRDEGIRRSKILKQTQCAQSSTGCDLVAAALLRERGNYVGHEKIMRRQFITRKAAYLGSRGAKTVSAPMPLSPVKAEAVRALSSAHPKSLDEPGAILSRP